MLPTLDEYLYNVCDEIFKIKFDNNEGSKYHHWTTFAYRLEVAMDVYHR